MGRTHSLDWQEVSRVEFGEPEKSPVTLARYTQR
ncbi:hypothetical protein STIAU_6221 [Stigmatella aurantiaca DW4/3-1]|uniref:Uncharacterized protein n=1 Tax=Stigmatella aurantiaca (strain DW4/3-1) TaxID=378806 RepID=Q08ZA5_STIAD|nr:hypothetical protein STIAU_6221 [Stigmatella aurantiaca DW4/3-1]